MLGRIAVSAGLILAATAPFRTALAEPTKADPNDAAQVALGKRVYDAHCAVCHGVSLEGQPNWRDRRPDGALPAPPHDAGGHTWHHPDQQLFDITKRGTAAFAGPGYRTDMREFGSILSDAEIWAVLAYIKSTWPPEIRGRQERMNAPRRAPSMPTVAPPQK
jgi:mono/diheme cytochrome c family protein